MRIASLEDEPAQAALIRQIVEDAGYTCTTFDRSADLMHALRDGQFDVLLLDRELPDVSGLDALTWIRGNLDRHLPVILLTCRISEDDIVEGLMAGADDYMCKPVRKGELLARIQSLHRRATADALPDASLQMSGYVFDGNARTVTLHGQPVGLTPKEYDLAFLLFRNEGRIIARNHIVAAVWGRELSAVSRTIDTHVSRLRSKLDLCAANGFRLQPVYTHGYRLEAIAAGHS